MIIIEPVGSGHYFVDNQSSEVLIAEFPVPVYNLAKDAIEHVDSAMNIALNARSLLLKDEGLLGVNPDPEKSFKEIRFYRTVNGHKKLAFDIKPVKNENWAKVIKSRSEHGYGLKDYLLTTTDADLK